MDKINIYIYELLITWVTLYAQTLWFQLWNEPYLILPLRPAYPNWLLSFLNLIADFVKSYTHSQLPQSYEIEQYDYPAVSSEYPWVRGTHWSLP